MNPAKPELNLNIKTHDAHVAELVHQNFGIFGRFSGFDVSGTHGIECGAKSAGCWDRTVVQTRVRG